MFWVFSGSLALLTALILFWPMIRSGGKQRMYVLALVLLIPTASLMVYKQVGAPEGIKISGIPQNSADGTAARSSENQIGDLITQLEQRLQEDPSDLQGWVLLGRTYKTTQRYQEAVGALEQANNIAPDNALVLVELAEAKMFNSGNGTIEAPIIAMLEQALLVDPVQQKALWLLGFASSQAGDDSRAVELWQRLLAEMPPEIEARSAIEQQIVQAQTRLGIQPEPVTEWPGLDISVQVSNPDFNVPEGAVLFIIARRPDMPGPPLGVRRISPVEFPVTIHMSNADSMMQVAPISSSETLAILARLSLSGNPVAGEGDLQSAIRSVQIDHSEPVSLVIGDS